MTPDEMAAAADEEAELVAAAAEWLGEHPEANRAAMRRFAKGLAARPPAKVRHAGRVTRRG